MGSTSHYGWGDLAKLVPAYETPREDDVAAQKAQESFADEVIDRLFKLNADRAAAQPKEKPAKPTKSVTKKSGAKKGAGQGELL